MADKFNAFADSLLNGTLNPKGNLADWQHASRLFVSDAMRLAPKSKFLYHVNFNINGTAGSILPDFTRKHVNEVGMLVKRADLPKFSAAVVTKNKYNRKKNIQTNITYNPITISFHDDNLGITSVMLESYYRYYFADGNQGWDRGRSAFKRGNADSTYRGSIDNGWKFGLDNNNPGFPFFDDITITQFARKKFTSFTLVNPIITDWQHDTVDAADGAGMMENTITIAYEAVFYNRDNVAYDNPKGFGDTAHYDRTPSPISPLGGSAGGLGTAIGTAISLAQYIAGGQNFNNPLEAILAGANLLGNIRNLSKEGLRQEGFNLLTGAIGAAAGIDVSGVSQTFFPKSGGKGNLVTAAAAIGLGLAAATSAGRSSTSNQKAFQNAGGDLKNALSAGQSSLFGR
jgi:hypothetical protein